MPRKTRTKRFRKYEHTEGAWHPAGTFTLAEFIRDNKHDEWVIEEFVPRLSKLRVRASWIYHGGAGGDDKFVRVR